MYIATGENFPDSLSAGPAIGRFQVSILLVTKDTIPDVTRTELQRLQPQRITVVGGPSVISDGVVSDLQNYGPTVRVAVAIGTRHRSRSARMRTSPGSRVC